MFTTSPLAAFDDNYIWVLEDLESDKVAVVDPGDAKVVQAYLARENKTLAAILITHHHADHTGGVNELVAQFSAPAYGPDHSRFNGVTHPLHEGDTVHLFGTELKVHEVPAHTLDHVAYSFEGDHPGLFCGDTLFLAGCGRLFEGDAKQMQRAMDIFSNLPDETEVFCTHEYSLANLKFALAVEPDNADIHEAVRRCTELREKNLPTLPSSIKTEKLINPYMRTDIPTVIAAANGWSSKENHDQVEVLAALREWKNSF